MYQNIFAGLLCLLVAPFVGALLIPSVAEWFGQALLSHASGMRALYPGLALAAKDYQEARRGLAKTPVATTVDCSSRLAFQGCTEMDDAIHKSMVKKDSPISTHDGTDIVTRARTSIDTIIADLMRD